MTVSPARRIHSVLTLPWRACLGQCAGSPRDAVDSSTLLPRAPDAPRSCSPLPDAPSCLRELAPCLGLHGPATIANALLRAMRSSRFSKQQLAYHVLLQLRGPQLFAVKSALEAQRPGALCGFVYGGCLGPRDRQAIISHMANQVPDGPRPLYVLSDIDNTFSPTRDCRYPKGTQGMPYPGQAALYAALAGACPQEHGRLTFLTARFGEPLLPVHCMSRRTRRRTVDSLQKLGVRNPSVLFGSLRYLPYPTLGGVEMAPLGTKKLVNFKRLAGVFPEYRYVFFGDSCEDDLRVAFTMLEEHPDSAAAAFIHDFDGRAGKPESRCMRDRAERAGVVFYTSAPGAALSACLQDGRLDLGVSPATVREVARVAQQELDAVPFTPEQQVERACLQSTLDLEHAAIDAALPL